MTAPTRRRTPGPTPAWYLSDPDMSRVDMLGVDFACNGTAMRLNPDERIVAVRRMLGQHSLTEMCRRVGAPYREEVSRIAKAAPDTMLCPACRQIAYHSDGFLRRHIDAQGMRWCPQSGEHFSVKTRSIQAMARG